MSYPTQYRSQINSIRAWKKRKKDKGIHLTSDDIWYKIRTKWPELCEEVHQYIWERV